MSAGEKATVLDRVESGVGLKRQVLAELGIPKSTYYRWRKRARDGCLEDRPGGSKIPWNRLTPQEESMVLNMAREMARVWGNMDQGRQKG